MDKLSKFELNEDQLTAVTGGNPLLAVLNPVGAVLTYMELLKIAERFGEGLGAGFYDATHE